MKQTHPSLIYLWLLLALLAAPLAFAADKDRQVIHLASVEMQPFAGTQMPNQGASITVVRAALRSMGWQLQVDFLPWVLAVRKAREGHGYDGYFPELQSDSAAEDFVFSEWIGSSPLGFAERADERVHWITLDDLASRKIGVVLGFVSTFDFDRKATQGELKLTTAPDDITNLRRLVRRNIDVATIDYYAFHYHLATDPTLAETGLSLRFNPRLLEYRDLFVALRKGPRGEELVEILNEGLNRIDVYRINQEYMNQFIHPDFIAASALSD